MKRLLGILFLLLVLVPEIHAQFTHYIIQFRDKAGTPFSIDKPEEFLSRRAIDRRERQDIQITESDLPIVPRYMDSVRLAGDVDVVSKSKWLNQVCIRTDDSAALQKIYSFTFVNHSFPVKRTTPPGFISREKLRQELKDVQTSKETGDIEDLNYGFNEGQITIHNGQYLHDQGFTGEGMLISIIDAGFYHYTTNPVFEKLISENRILDTYDFVERKEEVVQEDAHGMYCFTIMAAWKPGEMIGSCPNASYLLYRSEDVGSESPLEEQFWIAAAERSDSAGADIITTSLGYTLFDNPVFNHSYADMDGNTTLISRGASIASQKGMILMVAAGNSGNDPWHYISAPADADSILAVGAVNVAGEIAPFSSYGPSADGQVKPDGVSVGWNTVLANANGNIVQGNGTSFATPNLAGLVTCLWQAFPDFKWWEIIETVRQSSNRYQNPDNHYGYGIPDLKVAYTSLFHQRELRNLEQILGDKSFKIYPNPVTTYLKIAFRSQTDGEVHFKIYDVTGRLCAKKSVIVQADEPALVQFDQMQRLQKGIYILSFADGNQKRTQLFVVQ